MNEQANNAIFNTRLRQASSGGVCSSAADVIEEPLARVKLGMLPETFLQLVENASGLLLEQESGVYSFAHLTFQEYLTAAHIREKQLGDTLIAYVEDSWWRETIRLYCAMTDATPIIATCLRDDHPSVPALALALDDAEEARDIQPAVKARLETILNQGIEDTDPERRKVVADAFLTRRLHRMVYVKEGVYKDTSFITCAEYQVFLNEQQTQGGYYQPDHWKGVSFPVGLGQTPVLGVRRSDAQAFCDWLTTRDREGWHYRLPRIEEWPLEERRRQKELWAETGFWVEGEPGFVWSQGKPPDVSRQQFADRVSHDLASVGTLDLVRARDLAPVLDPESARARNAAHDLYLYLANTIARASALTSASALDLYIAIFLLRERIAGNLPAYEGILLVKDRRKENKPVT